MNKQEIRQVVKSIEVKDRQLKSNAISKTLFSLDRYVHCKSIFIYLSLSEEVCTDYIVTNAFLNGIKVFVPVLNDNIMKVVEINKGTIFKKDRYGIRQPIDEIQSDYDPFIDLAIIPMVAFDTCLNRLGHGKGYYDKWLRGKNIYKIGLCFDEYKFGKIPIENHDVPMDVIITDKKLYEKKI